MKTNNGLSPKATKIILGVLLVIIVVLTVMLFNQKPTNIFNIVNDSRSQESSIDKIEYAKESYECTEGDSFETEITASGIINGKLSTVSSYGTSNSDIAIVDENTIAKVNCINCKRVRVVCKKPGEVKLTAESSTGAKTTAKLTVKENKGSISFEKSSYNCDDATAFETVVIADTKGIKSVKSSDTSVATIDEYVTYVKNCSSYSKCMSIAGTLKNIRVVCKKKGKVTLSAESNGGAKATSTVNVKENKGSISFKENSYSCTAGKTIETVIYPSREISTAENRATVITYPQVKNYTSSDTSIATIDDKVKLQPYCGNCKAVRINCIKTGEVVLTATSNFGATTTAKVTVKQENGSISFDKSSYTCEVGKRFSVKVNLTGGAKSIKSFTSSDTSIADVMKVNIVSNCVTYNNGEAVSNCMPASAVKPGEEYLMVSCKKKGSATISATADTGISTSAKVTVTQAIGTVKFDKTSYSCNVGEKVEALVSSSEGYATVNSVWTDDSSIAPYVSGDTVKDGEKVVFDCKKAGKTTLHASTYSGATTSVPITVTANVGEISFEKSSFTCDEGFAFNVKLTYPGIMVNGEYKIASLKSYSTSNSKIATIDDKTFVQLNCTDCRVLRVVCHKAGKVSLYAETNFGAKASSSLTVKENKGTISFSKSSFTCKVGEKITTTLQPKKVPSSGTESGELLVELPEIRSYGLSDPNLLSYASLGYSSTKCVNLYGVYCEPTGEILEFTCKKAGTVTITGESDTGASVVSTVKITN